ncbi:MAG: DUF4127 family protein [Fimbriimonadaceae bacterium]|nr:DUF4127 family protein [Fimbriimonadaceae bacterium]QYK57762.1 MAG: DUF4127 family protein [Fimbriimonadaceae bacterium]
MRRSLLAAVIVLALASTGFAGPERIPRRILLVPIDDRPASMQFAQMIGAMAGITVETPPPDLLGRFTQPGRPEAIIDWLSPRLGSYEAAIVSADMLAYGGLIASRVDRSSQNLALKRLKAFAEVRAKYPDTKVYTFSAVMRLAPTATKATAGWRQQLGQFAALRQRYRIQQDPESLRKLRSLRAQIPAGEIEKYDAIRSRNHEIQRTLLRMTYDGVFQHTMLGQDDAQVTGPHVPETANLQQLAESLSLGERAFFAEGIDQIPNVLLSRALAEAASWRPRVRIVFADEEGRNKVAAYEAKTVDRSLKDQIFGSLGTIANPGESFDYSLYVNTPDPRGFALDAFLGSLKSEVDQGMPVAVADINLGKTGTGDLRLYDALLDSGRSTRVLAYAGWNTAGNTMGTTIPAANVYLLARRIGVDPVQREVALRAFILHRLVNDFEYHKYVRPKAYAMIDSMPGASREETYGPQLDKVNDEVKQSLGERLQDRFREQILGTRFFAGQTQFEVTGLKGVDIGLPWPRAYEVRLNFKIEVKPVGDIDPLDGVPILPLSPPGDPSR